MAIGRDTVELILDMQDSAARARQFDGELDRIEQTAKQVAGTFDDRWTGIRREIGDVAKAARVAKGDFIGFLDSGKSLKVLQAELRVAGREMAAYAERVKLAEQRQRQLTETARKGRLGNVRDGAKDFLLGAVGGSVAGATQLGLQIGVDVVRDSVSTFVEATRAQTYFESSVKRAGLAIDGQRVELERLRREFNLSEADGQRSYANALRVAENIGQPAKAAELQRAATRAVIGSGQGPGAAGDLIKAIQSGEDEAFNRIGLPNPEKIYRDYAKSIGVAASALTDLQKKQALFNAVLGEGAKNIDAVDKYQKSAAGSADRMAAAWEDAKKTLGGLTVGVFELSRTNLGKSLDITGLSNIVGGFNDVSEVIAKAEKGEGSLLTRALLDEVGLTGNKPKPEPDTLFDQGLLGAAQKAGNAFKGLIEQGAEFLKKRAEEAAKALAIRQAELGREITGLQRINRLRASETDPRADIKFRYQDERDRILKESQKRDGGKISAATFRELGLSNQAEQFELERAGRDITQGLDRQIAELRTHITGDANPLTAMVVEGKLHIADARREFAKLGPDFAGKARQVLDEQRRANALALGREIETSAKRVAGIEARIREVERSPLTAARDRVDAEAARRDQNALEGRGLEDLLDQLAGRSPRTGSSETERLINDALGLGPAGVSTAAARARLVEAAKSDRLNLAELNGGQADALQSILTNSRLRLATEHGPETAAERIDRVFADAEASSRRMAEALGSSFDDAEKTAIGARARDRSIVDDLEGFSADEFAQNPYARQQYLAALTRTRDRELADSAAALKAQQATADNTKAANELLKRVADHLAPTNGTPAPAAAPPAKVEVTNALNVKFTSPSPIAGVAVDGSAFDRVTRR